MSAEVFEPGLDRQHLWGRPSQKLSNLVAVTEVVSGCALLFSECEHLGTEQSLCDNLDKTHAPQFFP